MTTLFPHTLYGQYGVKLTTAPEVLAVCVYVPTRNVVPFSLSVLKSRVGFATLLNNSSEQKLLYLNCFLWYYKPYTNLESNFIGVHNLGRSDFVSCILQAELEVWSRVWR